MARTAFALLIWILAAGLAVGEERVALVIGNAAYQHGSALLNSRNDAEDVGSVLKQLGFKVIDGFDLDKTGLDRKLRDFTNALQGAKSGLFYYAGHGLQVSGENYLIPIDAQLSTVAALETETVRFSVVQGIMESLTKENVLFFDACRQNPFVSGLASGAGGRSAIARGLAVVRTFGVGTFVGFSAQPGAVAYDIGGGRNSPFTGALVRLVKTSDDDLVTTMMKVRKEVLMATGGAQVPWNQDSLIDKLYLRNAVKVQDASLAVEPQRTRRSLWLHNDSELLLLASGNNRAFFYKRPSEEVAAAGVKEGTLLFEGRLVEGQKYVGTAYRFSSKCPVRSYKVEGPITRDGGISVVLEGQVQRLHTDPCRLGEAYKDALVFRYSQLE